MSILMYVVRATLLGQRLCFEYVVFCAKLELHSLVDSLLDMVLL